MRQMLLLVFHAPLRAIRWYRSIRAAQSRAHKERGLCRICGEPADADSDRCADCRDNAVM